ncbi:GerMN domain-containing protein [Candidatus Sumerlaeota bacterium]
MAKRKNDKLGIRHYAGYLFGVLLVTAVVCAIGLFGIRELVTRLSSLHPDSGRQQPYYAATGADDVSARRRRQPELTIYFTAGGHLLHPQTFYLERKLEPYPKAQFILDELLNGPSAGYLLSPLPAGIELRALYLRGTTIVLDFDGSFQAAFGAGAADEIMGVHAITNSLLENMPHYTGVRLLIDGKAADALDGGLDLTNPLKRNYTLIADGM